MKTFKQIFSPPPASTFKEKRTSAQYLYIFNWIFIATCIFLVPINILTEDLITLALLPICIIASLVSLYFISKARLTASYFTSLIICAVVITVDLLISKEASGNNIIYRGVLSLLILVIASPLVFPKPRIILKLGIISFMVLALVYTIRIHPVSHITAVHIAELVNMALLFAIALFLSNHILVVHRNYIQFLEEENLILSKNQHSLEAALAEKSAKLSEMFGHLKKQKELYRSIVENSHYGIIIVDDKNNIIFANPEICRLTGYSPNEIIGHCFLEFVDAADKHRAVDHYQKCKSGEKRQTTCEISLICKAGTKIQGEMRIAATIFSDENIQTIIHFLDITNRKMIENTLALLYNLAINLTGNIDLEKAMEQIMDTLMSFEEIDSGGIYIRNLISGDIALVAHRGLSPEFISDVSHIPADAPQLKLLEKQKPIHIHFSELLSTFSPSHKEKQSKEGIRALSSLPLTFGNEIIGALNGASHSIDEFSDFTKKTLEALAAQISPVIARLRAETALRESERKYRELVEKTDSIFFAINEYGIITYISPAVVHHTGYMPEEIIGNNFIQFIHPLDKEIVLKKYDELQKGMLGPDEYRFITKDGKPLWIISNSQPIIVDGNFKGAIGVFTNISQRKKLEEERLEFKRNLLYNQKLESLRVLTAGIAHDFNNLLMAMKGNIELATIKIENPSSAKKFLQEAMEATNRAAELVRQMLIYTGNAQQKLQTVWLAKIIEDLHDIIKSAISPQVNLLLKLDMQARPIMGDIAQIKQIIMDLILNASEAIGDRSGEIVIKTGEMYCDKEFLKKLQPAAIISEGMYAFLEICDTGCGIAEENLNKIFEPFFTTKFTGRGLGLAVAIGIVRAHNGGILVESTPNKGTKICVLFPIAVTPLP